jgi:DNA repair protein RecO (recombination protein O)
MKFCTNGLIIREQHVGESDRLVTVLTRERGLVRAFASGARTIKGKKQAATQLLSYGNFAFSKGKDTYRITEAECLDVFFDLRIDLLKLSLAQYFCELCAVLVPEHDDAGAYLRIMLNGLKFLETDKYSHLQLKAVLELSMLTLSGYMPDVDGCHVCTGREQVMYFDPVNGVLQCAKHRNFNAVAVSDGVIKAMEYITNSTIDRLFSFSLSEEGLDCLAKVSEAFTLAQLERTFKTLDFYHALL